MLLFNVSGSVFRLFKVFEILNSLNIFNMLFICKSKENVLKCIRDDNTRNVRKYI